MRLMAAMLCAMVLGGCAKPTNNQTLTLITHNVLAYAGHYPDSAPQSFKTNPMVCKQAISFYQDLQPDFIFLQEAPEKPHTDTIAQQLHLHNHHFEANWAGNQQYPYGFPGAVLSKQQPIGLIDYVAQSANAIPDGLFERHWARTQWLLPNADTLYVFQTHLCADYGGNNNEAIRLQELALLKKEVDKLPSNAPVIILGDMNFTAYQAPYQEVISWGFANTDPEPKPSGTVPIPNPEHKIDFVFARMPQGYHLKSEVLRPQPLPSGGYLSDHVAVKATLSW